MKDREQRASVYRLLLRERPRGVGALFHRLALALARSASLAFLLLLSLYLYLWSSAVIRLRDGLLGAKLADSPQFEIFRHLPFDRLNVAELHASVFVFHLLFFLALLLWNRWLHGALARQRDEGWGLGGFYRKAMARIEGLPTLREGLEPGGLVLVSARPPSSRGTILPTLAALAATATWFFSAGSLAMGDSALFHCCEPVFCLPMAAMLFQRDSGWRALFSASYVLLLGTLGIYFLDPACLRGRFAWLQLWGGFLLVGLFLALVLRALLRRKATTERFLVLVDGNLKLLNGRGEERQLDGRTAPQVVEEAGAFQLQFRAKEGPSPSFRLRSRAELRVLSKFGPPVFGSLLSLPKREGALRRSGLSFALIFLALVWSGLYFTHYLFTAARLSTLSYRQFVAGPSSLIHEARHAEPYFPTAYWIPLLRALTAADGGLFAEAAHGGRTMERRLGLQDHPLQFETTRQMLRMKFTEQCEVLAKTLEALGPPPATPREAAERAWKRYGLLFEHHARNRGRFPSLSSNHLPLLEELLLKVIESGGGKQAEAAAALASLYGAVETWQWHGKTAPEMKERQSLLPRALDLLSSSAGGDEDGGDPVLRARLSFRCEDFSVTEGLLATTKRSAVATLLAIAATGHGSSSEEKLDGDLKRLKALEGDPDHAWDGAILASMRRPPEEEALSTVQAKLEGLARDADRRLLGRCLLFLAIDQSEHPGPGKEMIASLRKALEPKDRSLRDLNWPEWVADADLEYLEGVLEGQKQKLLRLATLPWYGGRRRALAHLAGKTPLGKGRFPAEGNEF